MRGEELRGRAAIGGRESERRVPMPRHRADGSAAPGMLVSQLLDRAERDGCWRGSCTVYRALYNEVETSTKERVRCMTREGLEGLGGRRVWFVTGASRGFGLEIVRQALERGDAIVATARDPRRMEEGLAGGGAQVDRQSRAFGLRRMSNLNGDSTRSASRTVTQPRWRKRWARRSTTPSRRWPAR